MEEIKAIVYNVDDVWAEVDIRTARLEAMEANLAQAKQELSEAVKDLLAANGGKNLVTRKGNVYTIMVRKETQHHYLRNGKAGRPPKAK